MTKPYQYTHAVCSDIYHTYSLTKSVILSSDYILLLSALCGDIGVANEATILEWVRSHAPCETSQFISPGDKLLWTNVFSDSPMIVNVVL